MLEFVHPLAFIGLLAPLLAWWLLPAHRERTGALRVPFFDDLVEAAGLEARSGAVVLSRRFMQMTVMVLVWTLLVVGLARPEWVGEPIVRTNAARVRRSKGGCGLAGTISPVLRHPRRGARATR